MKERPARLALGTLTAAQALGLSAAPMVVMVAGVVGRELAPSNSLATLPLATMVVGTAITSAPAALLMQRFGRRTGFLTGAAAGVTGGALGALAIAAASFAGLAIATLLIGAHLAFVMQYRFAAAELAGSAGEAKAVALVLAGGIAAGLLGPELGRRGMNLLATPWAGSFAAVAATCALLGVILFAGLAPSHPEPGPRPDPSSKPGPEPITEPGPAEPDDGSAGSTGRHTQPAIQTGTALLLRRPEFLFPAAAGTTAYAVMTLVMTATPLAMHGSGLGVDASAIVIQAHVVAMYAPSLLAGPLAARVGLDRLMGAGVIAMAACAITGLAGHGLGSWIAALVLLGIGWNLLFLGGTVALARAFPGRDRFRAQALNDLLVFGTQAVASLASGLVLAMGGWPAINIVAAVPLIAFSVLLASRALRSPLGPRGRPAASRAR